MKNRQFDFTIASGAQIFNRTLAVCFCSGFACLYTATAQNEIDVQKDIDVIGRTKPILVSVSGFTGEALQVLQFDLYVQGFAFTNAEAAQYLISGSNNGNLQGRASDRVNKNTLVSKAYSGASLHRQVHAFADDFVQALGRKGIAATKIAFKGIAARTARFTLRTSMGTTRRG